LIAEKIRAAEVSGARYWLPEGSKAGLASDDVGPASRALNHVPKKLIDQKALAPREFRFLTLADAGR
jgi:hypothetical protein